MSTLLLCLAGPMQSWGVQSHFSERDTLQEPSKSGVLGILCAALGVDREDWTSLEPLTLLRMGVRVDREGVVRYDYQTTSGVVKASGKVDKKDNTVQSWRYYLSDAVFLVGLQGDDRTLLERCQNALKNPRWTLALGRKSYVPSRSIWLENGVQDKPLQTALSSASWQADSRHEARRPPERVRYVIEHSQGALRPDVPTQAFSKRQFGTRRVAVQTAPWGVAPELSEQ